MERRASKIRSARVKSLRKLRRKQEIQGGLMMLTKINQVKMSGQMIV